MSLVSDRIPNSIPICSSAYTGKCCGRLFSTAVSIDGGYQPLMMWFCQSCHDRIKTKDQTFLTTGGIYAFPVPWSLLIPKHKSEKGVKRGCEATSCFNLSPSLIRFGSAKDCQLAFKVTTSINTPYIQFGLFEPSETHHLSNNFLRSFRYHDIKIDDRRTKPTGAKGWRGRQPFGKVSWSSRRGLW
jgi:hypothetical protein